MQNLPGTASIPVVLIGNAKGGVHKSTVTWNLGGALATPGVVTHKGLRVLIIDLDSQGSISDLLRKSDHKNLDGEEMKLAMWSADKALPVRRARHDGVEMFYVEGGLHVAQINTLLAQDALVNHMIGMNADGKSNAVLGAQEAFGTDEPNYAQVQHFRQAVLKYLEGSPLHDAYAKGAHTSLYKLIHEASSRHSFDMVLIDTGPSADSIVSEALQAASHVLTVSTPSEMAIRGANRYDQYIDELLEHYGLAEEIRPLGLLVTGMPTRGGVEEANQALERYANDEDIIPCRIRYSLENLKATQGDKRTPMVAKMTRRDKRMGTTPEHPDLPGSLLRAPRSRAEVAEWMQVARHIYADIRSGD